MDELRKKTKVELEKDINKSILEVSKLSVESKVNPQKDTNLIYKKKKEIARLKTVMSSIKE